MICLMEIFFWWWLLHLVVCKPNPSKKLPSYPYGAFHAVGAKLSVAGASLIFGGGVIYVWHA